MISIIHRPYWLGIIHQAWKKRSLVWLNGARRSGKTSLAKMMDGAVYLNCDLPSVVRRLSDPESLYSSLVKDSIIIFDEIHRLEDPSRVLKIGTDEFPELRILATGSSTLEATRKFRDALTGRKTTVYLSPVLWEETRNVFNINDLDVRLLHGGLPEPLRAAAKDPSYFAEWIDSFYARDVQELFNVKNREGYIRLMHLLYRSSGNLIEYSSLSKNSGLSRPTVATYIESLRIANNIFLLSPYHAGGKRELTHRPKCYTFDTGMVTYIKGWNEIREEDRGILWEHLVLDMLRVHYSGEKIYYWRDKSEREIDFVILKGDGKIDIFECKINPDQLSIQTISVFREIYPEGRNMCVSPYIKEDYSVNIKGFKIEFTSNP